MSPTNAASHPTSGSVLIRWLPRSLELQLVLLTACCLALSILGYGYFSARSQTEAARQTVTAQLAALAKNLATVDAYFLLTNEPENIEKLTLQTATVQGIYSVLVTDLSGVPISEVVNKNGTWSPRFNRTRVPLPDAQGPDSLIQTAPDPGGQRDFLAGTSGTLSAWQPIVGPQPLGWVRVNYRLDAFEAIARDIRIEAFKTIGLAMTLTLLLLWWLLRPSMRALREATAFASQLDIAAGTTLKVSHWTREIESLGNALNVVSARLLVQNVDLTNQKFALDQHAIVSITDLQGNITYANSRFCEISGYAREELLGQNHRIVKSDEHPPAVFEDLWHTITSGKVWRGDIKNRKKDGGYYWVSATIVPLIGVDGLPHHYIGIRTDITTNKNLEQSLQFAKEQAEGAALAKGQFLANMSHEIRTPMNAVLGMLRLLQNTPLTERQLDYAGKAEGAAQSLLGLLNDILDFSKIDAGKMQLELHPFRLDKLLRDLAVIVSANVNNKPVEVLFDIDPAAPRILMGDAMRLNQVLINLCSNAIKFTARGEVIVRVSVVAQTLQAVTLRFAVRDSGIGIAPENQKHIFDGFSQAEASTTRRFGGTGLGLSISRKLVVLMGGDLGLQSELGKGSTFWFQISLPISHEAPGEASELAPPRLGTELRVLLVDDNPMARDILAAMARSLGWRVDAVCSGQEALALLQTPLTTTGQSPYQVLLLDWQMPGMDGWETLQYLRALRPAPDLAVVMVTAYHRDLLNQRSAEEQALLQGFLVKPVTDTMLFDAVSQALADLPGRPGQAVVPAERTKPLQGLRLLVVEDNIINQQVAQEMLGSEGAQVELAANGQLGVEAVRRAILAGTPFDLVLMDIQMPVMDGYAATRVLREDLGLTRLPIIAMTANAMASDRAACLAAGMNDHVGKPFHLAQLTQLILHPPPLESSEAASEPFAQVATSPAPLAAAVFDTLPPVDSVDSIAALERLGGNRALYVRVLQSFLTDIVTLPDQFEGQLIAANLISAERLLHTLKGLSSTVGASYLAAVARRAEITVRQARETRRPLDTLSLAAELRTAMVNTQMVIQRVVQSFGPVHGVSTPHLTGPADEVLLGELMALLRASDMRAVEVFEQLRQAPPQSHSVAWQQLCSAMNAFDFKRAAEAADMLLNQEL